MSQELSTVINELNLQRRLEGLDPVDPVSQRWAVINYIYDQLAGEKLYGTRTARQASKRKQQLELAKEQLLETV